MQNEINRIQALYREWLQLQEKLQREQKDWQRANQIMHELNAFYFDGQFQEFYEKMEQGADVDLRTEGEYSVMSEDTLWNAFHEHQQLAWARLRGAIDVLDKQDE
ncbi:DUF4298 domain-containing protein [Wielerella bovis]|uniref:DUF4298 domain-containing protein n=1 Tax=Wielerella bovis TaxID=2917790 RepID=UPI002019D41E|nr:DUF4298 domain-containing protein [Wielerella bovis]ULJ59992.1 DUF4298 domain-containing protein [Wielerella bovis]ULJ68964.1 DUF4298 domain-containing protein [Wielerella bovis]